MTSFYYVVSEIALNFILHLLEEGHGHPIEELLRARLRPTTFTATYVVGEVRNFEAEVMNFEARFWTCHAPRVARKCRHRRREALMAEHIRRLEFVRELFEISLELCRR